MQNCSSFLAGMKLYLKAGTKLYRITLPSVNVWLIRNTSVSDQKVIWYSVNAALSLNEIDKQLQSFCFTIGRLPPKQKCVD